MGAVGLHALDPGLLVLWSWVPWGRDPGCCGNGCHRTETLTVGLGAGGLELDSAVKMGAVGQMVLWVFDSECCGDGCCRAETHSAVGYGCYAYGCCGCCGT